MKDDKDVRTVGQILVSIMNMVYSIYKGGDLRKTAEAKSLIDNLIVKWENTMVGKK